MDISEWRHELRDCRELWRRITNHPHLVGQKVGAISNSQLNAHGDFSHNWRIISHVGTQAKALAERCAWLLIETPSTCNRPAILALANSAGQWCQFVAENVAESRQIEREICVEVFDDQPDRSLILERWTIDELSTASETAINTMLMWEAAAVDSPKTIATGKAAVDRPVEPRKRKWDDLCKMHSVMKNANAAVTHADIVAAYRKRYSQRTKPSEKNLRDALDYRHRRKQQNGDVQK